MGKKYIIEIIDKPFKDDNGREVWRAKGFNTLYFDQNGLDKLDEYKEPETHKSHEFKVGDVCYMTFSSREDKILLTYIGDNTVSYIWSDGQVSSAFLNDFKNCAKFIYHSDALRDFFGDFFGGNK